ncbi:hypothetical protein CWRG_01670 [Chthonomonas calidirosea]|uniref:hypothetical protein n=1 Tax=Chthonomonas calidirosea TaxID=454171 RepID=UPI0006DD4D65|nr:hypothetical protein [Chthonomonas calidirosea]CEK16945.1 hypothetical protein CWRG_01670 [Chthonomonas calidirosea]
MDATVEARLVAQLLMLQGSPTTVNGSAIGNGLWTRAEPNRIQMLMGDLVAQQAVYEVKLAGSLWGQVHVGDEVTNVATGLHLVVRWVDVSDVGGVPVVVTLLGIALSE